MEVSTPRRISRFHCRTRRFGNSPTLEKHPKRTRHGSDRTVARSGEFKAFCAARGPWSLSIRWNMRRVHFPYASVPTWVRSATALEPSTREIARSISPSGHNATARLAIAATPGSSPKRKARSSSRPGWNRASALSRCSRASRYSPANQRVMPSGPLSDASFRGIGSRFDVAKEGRCVHPHR